MLLERTPRLLALLFATALSIGGASVAVASKPDTQSGPRPLAVSVPPEPVSVVLGAASIVPVRVLNPGTTPVAVSVTGGAVQLADEGAVTVTAESDPNWQGNVDFPPGYLVVPANGYVDAPLTVRVPAQLSPDLYFVGFLVTPLATGAGTLKVINQIGSFFMLDVPGPRDRELSAALDGSRFVLGSQSEKTLHVRNVGGAAVRFWGENDATSFPAGGTTHQQRIDKSLLPVGRERSFSVTGKPAWPIGLVTMKVHVFYPGRTEESAQEIVLTKRVLVVNPLALVALVALIVALAALWILRRRRRRQHNFAGSPRALRPEAA